MIKLPDPKVENEKLYKHVLSELDRLWDTPHDRGDFAYLLDWLADYEDEYYPIDPPTEPYLDAGRIYESESQLDESLHSAQFAVDVSGLADFSRHPEIEDFTCRYVINGYIGDTSNEKYYPAKAMRLIAKINRMLELRLDDLLTEEFENA